MSPRAAADGGYFMPVFYMRAGAAQRCRWDPTVLPTGDVPTSACATACAITGILLPPASEATLASTEPGPRRPTKAAGIPAGWLTKARFLGLRREPRLVEGPAPS